MRGEIQQNVFADVGSEIDQLRSRELVVDGKSMHLDVEPKRLQATHTFQFGRLDKIARYPERAFRDSEVERVTQRPGADDRFRRQLGNRAFLFAFKMQAVRLDL